MAGRYTYMHENGTQSHPGQNFVYDWLRERLAFMRAAFAWEAYYSLLAFHDPALSPHPDNFHSLPHVI